MESENRRYSSVAMALHWAMAGLILFMIWLGRNMENHEARFQLHKSIGITLLVLTLIRILWRLYNKPPPLPSDTKPIEAKLSHLVQMGFYALMLLIPLGGWLMVSVSEFRVPTVLFETVSWPRLPLPRNEAFYETLAFLHANGATYGFLGLLLLHIAGALKHQIKDETGVLMRILPFSKLPKPKTRGLLPALAIPLFFFTAVAAAPLMQGAQTSLGTTAKNSASETASPELLITPNWELTDEARMISFAFIHDGAEYEGRFENWEAQIAFFPDDLTASKVKVSVDLRSADTGKVLYNDSLKAGEWFSVKANPTAHVILSNFEAGPSANSYQAQASITLKGITATVPFVFDLKPLDGGLMNMTGSTVLSRKSLSLGQDSDPDAEWVSETVTVKAELQAKRK